MEEQNKYISDLLIRYVNGLYTRNDIETLRKLASSITERAELESEMDRVWSEAQDLPQSDSHNHLLYKKEAQDLLDKTRKRERRISLSTFIKYAASIAIIVSIGFGAKLYLNHSAKQHASASDHLLTEISVNHGEHKQVTLPDGTVVHLNAGTVMRYPTDPAGAGRRLPDHSRNGRRSFFQCHERRGQALHRPYPTSRRKSTRNLFQRKSLSRG